MVELWNEITDSFAIGGCHFIETTMSDSRAPRTMILVLKDSVWGSRKSVWTIFCWIRGRIRAQFKMAIYYETMILVPKCRFLWSMNPVVMMFSRFRCSIMTKLKMATNMSTKNVIIFLIHSFWLQVLKWKYHIKLLQIKSCHYYSLLHLSGM